MEFDSRDCSRPGGPPRGLKGARINRDYTARMMRWLLWGLAVVIVIVALAFIVESPLRHARTAGDETAALSSVRAIVSAQIVFSLDCSGHYASTLTELGRAPGRPLSPDLGVADVVEKLGYRLSIDAAASPDAPACQGLPAAAAAKTYIVRAEPVAPEGQKFFAANADGEVFQAMQSIRFANGTPTGDVQKVR